MTIEYIDPVSYKRMQTRLAAERAAAKAAEEAESARILEERQKAEAAPLKELVGRLFQIVEPDVFIEHCRSANVRTAIMRYPKLPEDESFAVRSISKAVFLPAVVTAEPKKLRRAESYAVNAVIGEDKDIYLGVERTNRNAVPVNVVDTRFVEFFLGKAPQLRFSEDEYHKLNNTSLYGVLTCIDKKYGMDVSLFYDANVAAQGMLQPIMDSIQQRIQVAQEV